MDREIGGYEYRRSVAPEVPIRPGASIEIMNIEYMDEDGNMKKINPSR